MTGVHLRAGAATDVGRVRPHNEDDLLAEGTVFAVADGLGGHAAGEVASGIAVRALRELAVRPDLRRRDVVGAIAEANDRILDSVHEHPEQRGMGTTVSGLALVTEAGRPQWLVFNVGDSRVYRFADGELHQVTVDHSEVQELVDAGLLTAAEAARHPLRNLLTRALGAREIGGVDTVLLDPVAGEWFLACSDGLTGELSDAEIAAVLARGGDPQEVAQSLVSAAVSAGGRDNVTAVVVLVEGVEGGPDAG